MTDQLEQSLRSSLERRAGQLRPRPLPTAAIIARARRATRLRRSAAVTLGTLAVALVLLLGALSVPKNTKPPIGPSPAPTSTPSPVPAATAGVALISGRTVQSGDGSRTVLRLPAGVQPSSAAKAEGGWVVLARDELWWVPDGGLARLIVEGMANPGRDWLVSSDGSRLVVLEYSFLISYEVPSLHQVASRDLPHDRSYDLVGLSGAVALVQTRPATSEDDVTAIAWNIVTGQSTPAGVAPLMVADLSVSGMVLRRTGSVRAGTACLRVDPVAAALVASPGGLCGAAVSSFGSATLSPVGTWITVQDSGSQPGRPRYLLARADDIDAGRWNPVPLPADVDYVFGWVGRERLLASVDLDRQAYVVCGVDGSCARLALPPDLPEAQPLVRLPA